jgi:hypothetical protein
MSHAFSTRLSGVDELSFTVVNHGKGVGTDTVENEMREISNGRKKGRISRLARIKREREVNGQ